MFEDDSWGRQVMPGVYVIDRVAGEPTEKKNTSSTTTVNYEIVYKEIDEITHLIGHLQRSNRELMEMMLGEGAGAFPSQEEEEEEKEGREFDDEGQGMAALLQNEEEEEEDLHNIDKEEEREPLTVSVEEKEFFSEVIRENESVIKAKEKELVRLRKLVEHHQCKCSAAATAVPAPVVVPSANTVEEHSERLTL